MLKVRAKFGSGIFKKKTMEQIFGNEKDVFVFLDEIYVKDKNSRKGVLGTSQVRVKTKG